MHDQYWSLDRLGVKSDYKKAHGGVDKSALHTLASKLQKKRKRTWKSDKRAENVINWNCLSEKIRDPEGLGAENQKRGQFKEEKSDEKLLRYWHQIL